MAEPDGSTGRHVPSVPIKDASAPAGSDEQEIDPMRAPDLNAIEAYWKREVQGPDHDLQAERRQYKEESGVEVASSYVRSAEGESRFRGLRIDGNGRLSEVAREALRAQLDPAAPEKHSGGDGKR